MAKGELSELIDPAIGYSFAEWIDRIEDIALDRGDFEPLGPNHSAVMIEGNSNLLVTFESAENIRAQATSDVPLGWSLAEGQNWSQLCILSNAESWFRHRAIYQYFDRLVDEAFFDRFDNVVFYGAGPGGYAPAAYSVAAPGATLFLIGPQATLDAGIAGWDRRYPQARRIEFGDRYGYAPDMAEAAAEAFILFDPEEICDAIHASLFRGDHVRHIRCALLDGQIETFLRRMGLLDGLMLMAMRGKLTPGLIHKALRERRNYLPYLRRLLAHAEAENRPYLSGLLCRAVLTRANIPRFRGQLAKAEKLLAAEGRSLPAQRLRETA